MNNTKNILLVTSIISLLVLGTIVLPLQQNVQAQKDTKDIKQSIKEETNAQSASQKAGQENFCYRSQDCEQTNQGQQIVGKDNEAAGFNDQSANANVQTPGAQPTQQPTETPVTPPATPPATPPVTPPATPPVTPPATPPATPPVTPPVTPPAPTCQTCFTAAFASAGLSQTQINTFLTAMGAISLDQLCGLPTLNAIALHTELDIPIGATNVNILIQCLINAGVIVTAGPPTV